MNFNKTSLALAVAALIVSPALYASEPDGGDHHGGSIDASINNEVSVEIDKRVDYDLDVDIEGQGDIRVFSSATALVDDKQLNGHNLGTNVHHENEASLDGSALEGATGNIGVNISAGDNNQQDNAAAVAAADAYFVFGSADAEVVVAQDNGANVTLNSGNTNTSDLGGNALQGAAGNIGVNISTGNNIQQKNNMAVASSPSRLSVANTANIQRSAGNATVNEGRMDVYTDRTQVAISGTLEGGYSGTTSGSYQGGASGSYSGQSDQIGNVYPDIWVVNEDVDPHGQHPNSPSETGHFDLDTQTQGGSDLNGDGGALAFNEDGSYSGREGGNWGGTEVGEQSLSGSLTGFVTTTRLVYTATSNNAHMGDSALAGASGNIGVNIASGTGNQQNNSMAMSYASGTAPLPDMGGQLPGIE